MWRIDVDKHNGKGWVIHRLGFRTRQAAEDEIELRRPLWQDRMGWDVKAVKDTPPNGTAPAGLARMLG